MTAPTTDNTAKPRAEGFGLALDKDLFRLALSPDRQAEFDTADLEPPAFDTRSNPEELNEDFGRTFARDDFTGGEGLDRAHTRAERINKDSRVYDSDGVNLTPPQHGHAREVQTLKAMEAVHTSAASNPVRMAYDGTSLYFTEGTNVRKSTSLGSVPAFATESPHAGEAAVNANDLAVLGADIYAALGVNGIHRRVGAVWAHWSDVQATRVWNAKSRILASVGTTLYEAAAGAGSTLLYTLPSGKVWNDVCDAGDAILACASDGNIYAFAPDATTGALRLYAQSFIEGEIPTAVAYAQGNVFYGTGQATQIPAGVMGRLWKAELSEGLTIVNGQLLREWEPWNGATTADNSPYEIMVSRDAVYIGVAGSAPASISSGISSAAAYLWRYDLAVGALQRWTQASLHPQPVMSIIDIGGRLWRSTALAAGQTGRITRDHATEYGSGWIITPYADFFSSAMKAWVGARLDAVVTGNQIIGLSYSTNPDALTDYQHPSWTFVMNFTAASTADVEQALSGVTARGLAIKLTLNIDPAARTTSPRLRSFAFRAYPGGGGGSTKTDKTIVVPVNVSDQIKMRGRRPFTVRGRGATEFARLRAYEGKAATLRLYDPPLTMRGIVLKVRTPVVDQPTNGSATVFCEVVFRGRET